MRSGDERSSHADGNGALAHALHVTVTRPHPPRDRYDVRCAPWPPTGTVAGCGRRRAVPDARARASETIHYQLVLTPHDPVDGLPVRGAAVGATVRVTFTGLDY